MICRTICRYILRYINIEIIQHRVISLLVSQVLGIAIGRSHRWYVFHSGQGFVACTRLITHLVLGWPAWPESKLKRLERLEPMRIRFNNAEILVSWFVKLKLPVNQIQLKYEKHWFVKLWPFSWPDICNEMICWLWKFVFCRYIIGGATGGPAYGKTNHMWHETQWIKVLEVLG